MEASQPRRLRAWVIIAAAASVTIVDGFDAFSMSLAAPSIARSLGLSTAQLGPIFASTMGGMIIGAFGGGALADKIGRLRVLLVALSLFGLAALILPILSTVMELIANRVIAGIGLGAAAPIAVASLNRASARPPTDLAVSIVWGGIPLGGILAAGFNYFVVPWAGWQSLFVAGCVLPGLVALVAYLVFRANGHADAGTSAAPKPRVADLFANGRAGRTCATFAMFFFGYVTTSIIVNWLPTVLDREGATPGMISATFAALNVGSAVGTLGLGLLAVGLPSRYNLMWAWCLAGMCAVAASAFGATNLLSVFAVSAATVAAGSQALSVAFANRLHRHGNLETTTVGLMLSGGRIGQFAALGLSGVLLTMGLAARELFAFAGISALIAAGIALFLARPVIGGRA